MVETFYEKLVIAVQLIATGRLTFEELPHNGVFINVLEALTKLISTIVQNCAKKFEEEPIVRHIGQIYWASR